MLKRILPCAGYGTRMGLTPEQSKEIRIPSPLYPNMPIITEHFGSSGENIVVTRPDKSELIDKLRGINCHIVRHSVNGEWPSSVSASRPYWDKKNLLTLPDTYYKNMKKVEEEIVNLLDKYDLVLGCFFAPDLNSYGVLHDGIIWEKPKHPVPLGMAWGCIGFRPHVGAALFEALERQKYFSLSDVKYTTIMLEGFKDYGRP